MNKILIESVSKKKNYKKYVVKTSEGEEYIVNEDTIIKFHLFKDTTYSKEEFSKIIYDIKINEFFNKVLRYLSYGPRSEYEIRIYIQKNDAEKILHSKDYDEIVSRLKTLNYLNDELYVKQIIDYYKETKGKKYIINFLKDKKVDNEIVEKLINEYSSDEEMEVASKISDKYLQTVRKYPLKKQQVLLISKLNRLGFSSSVISKIINNLEYVDDSDEMLEKDILKLKRKLDRKELTEYEKKQYIINSLMSKGYEYRKIVEVLKQ